MDGQFSPFIGSTMTIPQVDGTEIKSDTDIVYDETSKIKKKYTIEEIEEVLRVVVPGLYSEWRPNQLTVIQQIVNSDCKYIALQAPPGYGKSVTAIGEMIMGEGRGIAVTQTKQLGDQYVRDFFPVGLKTVKGRGNFSCTIIPEKTADVAPCVAGIKCMYKSGGCDYYDQKSEAVDTKLVSMNIHYFLYEVNYSGQFSDVDVLFIDEAQKLEDAMMGFIEVRLNKARYFEEGLKLPDNPTFDTLTDWAEKAEPLIKQELSEVLDELESNNTNEILALRGIRLQTAYRNISKFIGLVNKTWIIEKEENNIIIKPTLIGEYMEKYIFQHARKIVFMSATLPRSIIESFNLTDYEYLNIPSSFSPTQRPAIWIPAANLARSAENPGMELKKLTTAVDAILDKFPEQKGMIHTVNYKISQFLMQNSKNVNRFRTHESAAERSDVLEKFKRNNDNGVLVSPSFTEGVDLPYDLCRFQIIAKIPYESLGNPQVKARMEVDNQWYATNAIVTMIQAYGRAMRAEDDQGITYILDSSLMNLINRWRNVFDNMTYFLDALWIMDESKLIPFSEFDANPKLTRRKRY